MTARVLVVDDLLANVRLLETKLTAEYFEVSTAMNGIDALETIQRVRPDIVLLDVMMPGMDGIEVCRQIKSNPKTQHIPVIMVTALDQSEDRVRGLEAGADDFLTKPVNDVALFSRVKSLVRLKMLTDELLVSAPKDEDPLSALGISSLEDIETSGKILVVDDRGTLFDRVSGFLSDEHELTKVSDPQKGIFVATENEFDLVIVDLDMDEFDGLRLCSQLRSLERTRQIPILAIIDPDDNKKMLRALEMGVNDYLSRPIDNHELAARVKTLLRRWRYTQKLRTHARQSMELAVTDPLTNLFNRRYMESQLSKWVDNAADRGKSLSLLTFDIDHFKRVNDTSGHDAGDAVLVELALRIKKNIRNVDLACRTGGEEFVVILPNTPTATAQKVAERLRRAVCAKSFSVPEKDKMINITISVGLSSFEGCTDTQEKMFKRADNALYQAKERGRNKVISAAA